MRSIARFVKDMREMCIVDARPTIGDDNRHLGARNADMYIDDSAVVGEGDGVVEQLLYDAGNGACVAHHVGQIGRDDEIHADVTQRRFPALFDDCRDERRERKRQKAYAILATAEEPEIVRGHDHAVESTRCRGDRIDDGFAFMALFEQGEPHHYRRERVFDVVAKLRNKVCILKDLLHAKDERSLLGCRCERAHMCELSNPCTPRQLEFRAFRFSQCRLRWLGTVRA